MAENMQTCDNCGDESTILTKAHGEWICDGCLDDLYDGDTGEY